MFLLEICSSSSFSCCSYILRLIAEFVRGVKKCPKMNSSKFLCLKIFSVLCIKKKKRKTTFEIII